MTMKAVYSWCGVNWSLRDCEIARSLGCSRQRVFQKRRQVAANKTKEAVLPRRSSIPLVRPAGPRDFVLYYDRLLPALDGPLERRLKTAMEALTREKARIEHEIEVVNSGIEMLERFGES
jgi:hypothetical protein